MTQASSKAGTAADPAPPAEPRNVIEALAAVMGDLPAIGKKERSPQGYNFRGIEAITAHAQALFSKYRIVFVPRVIAWEIREITVNGKPWTDTIEEIEYTVYGPGGVDDAITVGPILAIGRDNSDKGSNKALTQAYKYALIQTLTVGDSSSDADHGSPEADAGGAPAEEERPPTEEERRGLAWGRMRLVIERGKIARDEAENIAKILEADVQTTAGAEAVAAALEHLEATGELPAGPAPTDPPEASESGPSGPPTEEGQSPSAELVSRLLEVATAEQDAERRAFLEGIAELVGEMGLVEPEVRHVLGHAGRKNVAKALAAAETDELRTADELLGAEYERRLAVEAANNPPLERAPGS